VLSEEVSQSGTFFVLFISSIRGDRFCQVLQNAI
jgi:hypothetical protein